MKLGQSAMEKLRAEVTGRLTVGDELVIAGAVALGGTVLLSEKNRGRLARYFSAGFLEDCIHLEETYGAEFQAELMETEKEKRYFLRGAAGALPEVTAYFAMGEGGVLSAVWKMAEASGVGLSVDLRKIPVRQETIEICEFFQLNPYRLFSRGAVLAGTKNGRVLAEELTRRGIPAAVIGQAVKGNDRLLFSGESARYLERPVPDELWKIMEKERL